MFNLLFETIQRDSIISFPAFGNLTMNPPASINIFGRDIYMYAIVIALGALIAILYCSKRAPDFGLTEDDVYDVVIPTLPLGIIGARLYYVIFEFDYFKAHPEEILAIWNGGLAIYGGIIVGIIVAFTVCKIKKIKPFAMIDLIVFGLLIGQILGRWGNFFNREAFGAETDIFIRMGLTDSFGDTIYVHPTFLYESLWNLCVLIYLIVWEKRGKRNFDGKMILLYFHLYGLGRVWIEGLRTDSLYVGHTGIRVSQLLSAVMIIVSAVLLIVNKKSIENRCKKADTIINPSETENIAEIAEATDTSASGTEPEINKVEE